MAATEAPPVKLHTKLLYASGTMAFGIKEGGLSAFLLLYYNQVIGMPASLVGLAIAVALVVDSVLDPIIGQVSDNWRSRLGRRHPFMYAATIPVAVSFLLLWNPPAGWPHGALFAYLVVTAIFVRTFLTIYEIPSSALLAELTTDYDERTKIFGYRSLFATVGGAGMLILTYSVFLQPTPEYPQGQLNPEGYRRYAMAAALAMLTIMVISAVSTHHRIPFLRTPPPQPRMTVIQVGRQMARTVSHRSLVALLVATLFVAVGGGITGGLYLYIKTFFWELSSAQLAQLTLPAIAGPFAALVFAPWIAKRLGKKHAAMLMYASSVLVGVTPLSLRLLGLAPPNGSDALLIMLAVAGFGAPAFAAGASMLAGSMLADVVEDSEVKTGRRSEGLFFSAHTFVQKAVSGTGIFFSGLIISLVNFPPNAKPDQVQPEVLRNLALVYLPALVFCFGCAVACIGMYRITRSQHEENVRKLRSLAALKLSTSGEPEAEDAVPAAQPMPAAKN